MLTGHEHDRLRTRIGSLLTHLRQPTEEPLGVIGGADSLSALIIGACEAESKWQPAPSASRCCHGSFRDEMSTVRTLEAFKLREEMPAAT
jgi:hypothetical protein